MNDKKENSKISPDPATTHREKPAEGSNGRPSTPAAAVPTKKFSRAEEIPAKRGPGRPPKIEVQRGGAEAPASASRGTTFPAAAPAPSASPAKPDAMISGARGLLQMAAGISAGITWAALKIDYMAALSVWQFTPKELEQIEGPTYVFLEKYGPMLDDYGIEIQFAGAILPILTAKVFAILAMKRAIEKQTSSLPPPQQPPAVTPIRPEANSNRREPDPPAPTPTPQASENDSPAGDLPSAFLHNKVDSATELVIL
ncbi:MAG TPA: hypothetical protein VKP58_08135 [Candidatus Acidoferrum sp.]|nr:hypothetical protein [Candidatus Acidoferrum sp.]